MLNLLDQLRENVAQFKTDVAIIHGDNSYTYDDLGRLITHVSQELSSKSLNAGDHVALVLENSVEYVASYYGVWGAECSVVALNTALKSDDFSKLVVHSDAKVLIHDGKNRELRKNLSSIAEMGIEVININDLLAECNKQGEFEFPAPRLDSGSLASIIYTSGTTGHPKGVMLSHQNLVANIYSIVQYLALKQSDRLLCVLPFFYSYGNSVLHTHLYVGASLVLENSFMYPQRVLESLVKNEATGFSGVPSTFALLMSRTKLEEFDLTKLRYVTQAGGGMPPSDIKKFCSYINDAHFFVMYGQTEASARLAFMPPEYLESKLGSVGVSIPNVVIEIKNASGETLAPNQVGEICAQGDNVMMGYWKDQEETASVISDTWLRTGDDGYMDSDGFIYIQGRNKEMIKSGAHRIAPKEIEEVIVELDGVCECAVLGIPDDIMGQVIKAIVVKSEDAELVERDVLKYSHQKLASYKIPKVVEFADALPKTASGKVQKHLLN